MEDDVTTVDDQVITEDQSSAGSSPDNTGSQGQTQTPPEPQNQNHDGGGQPEPQGDGGQQPQGGDDSGADDKPFNENPKFRERIQQIEGKYGGKAKNWDLINQLAAEDPNFALTVIKKMEDAGAAPKGTYEQAKARLEPQEAQNINDEQPGNDQQGQPNQLTEEQLIQKVLESHPDVKYAREERERREAQEAEMRINANKWLQNFEKDRPEIAQHPNAEQVRKMIYNEAQMQMQKGVGFKDAMDYGYKWVLKRDEVLEEYRQKGEISGLASNISQTAATPQGGTATPPKTHRALSDEERNAANLMNMSAEEYVKYVDNPNSGIVDV